MELVDLLNYAIAFFTLFVTFFLILLFIENRHRYRDTPKKPKTFPLVSIIVPAHNEEEYIEESIRSLLNSDYPNLEIIVIDDGSTDKTHEIASKFLPKIKLFKTNKGGKGKALNFGILKAKGELIATMDADSYILPDTITQLVAMIQEENAMAVTPAVKIKASGNWLKEFQRVEYLMILFSRKLLSFIDSVPVTPGPFSLFRREVFEKIGLFDENNLVEDQEIALRMQAHNFKIVSSMTAQVYTEPPEDIFSLLKQRIRWQRGGFRNYWKYRYMIRPKYGDFGLYFIPLNFLSLIAFFLVLALLINSFLTQPYYTNYILFDILGYSIGLYTFVGAFVLVVSILFTYLAVKSFPEEKVGIPYILTFIFFYWYLMLGYNVLFILKEIKGEGFEW